MIIETKTGLVFDPSDSRCHLIKRSSLGTSIYFVKCFDKSTGHVHFYFGSNPTAATEEDYIRDVMLRGNNVYDLFRELKDVIPESVRK